MGVRQKPYRTGKKFILHGVNIKWVKCLEGKVAIKIKTLTLHMLVEPLPGIHPVKQRQVWTAVVQRNCVLL